VTNRERGAARERILDVADRLFYERGIHAVGVDTVVAESAVAKTTLYSHFRSKDELIAAYLRRRSERWLAFVDDELAAQRGGPARRLLRVFDLLGDWFAEPGFRGCPFINACAEFADADHPASVVTRAHRQQLMARFVDLAAEAGAKAPERVAAQLMLLYDAALVSAQIEGGPAPARTARDAAAVLLEQACLPAAKPAATRRR
jgi:AcrR family transcriptional regulator